MPKERLIEKSLKKRNKTLANMSKYSYSKQLNSSFDEAVDKTIVALKDSGFGILSDIDVAKTVKEKLGVDFKKYRILGACNPPRAYRALQAEEEIGLFMPCNVIVYEKDDRVVVAAILPLKAFEVVDNKELEPLAREVEEILKKVIDSL